MATLIPSIGSRVSRMTGGERRLAERLEAKRTVEFNPAVNTIQITTMKVSKGLEFPVVRLASAGHMPAPGEDENGAARVRYVAVTRATQRLVIGVGTTCLE